MSVLEVPSLSPSRRALVVCEHDLLGEGIADLLRQRGVEVIVVHAYEPDTLDAGLILSPRLVVVEQASIPCLEHVHQACPDALIVDVSPVVGRGYPAPGTLLRFDSILEALHTIPA